MLRLDPSQHDQVRGLFRNERPGTLVGQHVLQTGRGSLHVDRLPRPNVAVAQSGLNFALVGDPSSLRIGALPEFFTGMIDAAEPFAPLLERSFPDLKIWERVILSLDREPNIRRPDHFEVRQLEAADAPRIGQLADDIRWISETWGGPTELASSGYACGAFSDGDLVSVAASFYVASGFEDIGVVTEAKLRGNSLSAACAGKLAQQIRARGRVPTWSTSPDNHASLRVAEKLGFEIVRHDRLYVIGQEIPAPARRAAAD